jgi:hypothetical protein
MSATGGHLKLPKLALDIIARQPIVNGNPYLFPRGKGKHFNAWSWGKEALDTTLKFDELWTIHDLRRTAKSLMSRAKVMSDDAERVVGHKRKETEGIADRVVGKKKRGVEAIYDRHEYFDEKAEALQALADLVQEIGGEKRTGKQHKRIALAGAKKKAV